MTIFQPQDQERQFVSRRDVLDPLASFSKHGFHLDDTEWPSVEHYYQAMKFEDPDYREQIRQAAHPSDAEKLGKSKKHGRRKDWDKVKEVYMTRGTYIKCRTHTEVAQALLKTGDTHLVESSQYDYFWGCGRDMRGTNAYGKVLMNVRQKLRDENS